MKITTDSIINAKQENVDCFSSYLAEIEKRLFNMFSASKQGIKATAMEKHRLQGFMQAGVYLKIQTLEEQQALIEMVHLKVHGKTITQRSQELARRGIRPDTSIDYSYYDSPAHQRQSSEPVG